MHLPFFAAPRYRRRGYAAGASIFAPENRSFGKKLCRQKRSAEVRR